jgi:hypothetical protein
MRPIMYFWDRPPILKVRSLALNCPKTDTSLTTDTGSNWKCIWKMIIAGLMRPIYIITSLRVMWQERGELEVISNTR